MSDWRGWDRFVWNSKLFFYYFSCDEIDSPAVTSLSVSAEDLRRVTGDLTANPDEVKNVFLKLVRSSISGEKTSTSFQNKMANAGRHNQIDLSFFYLVVTCLAANEIIEDSEADSTSEKILNEFRRVMEELLQVADVTIDIALAETWEKFRDFLNSISTAVDTEGVNQNLRNLKLPDPGLESHIGYSKKLVFPSRKDQERLASVLNQSELIEDEPQIEAVLNTVLRNKRHFSPQFQDAFNDFSNAQRNGATFLELFHHRFWSAVLSSCSNALLVAGADSAKFSILVESQGGNDFDFLLVASNGKLPRGIESVSSELDDWKQRILHVEATDDPIFGVLKNPAGFGSLGRVIGGGVIPFHLRSDRMYGTSKASELSESKWALIRRDCLADFGRIFGEVKEKDLIEAPHPDWVFVSQIRLKPVDIDAISNTALSGASILLKRVVRPYLKVLSPFNIGSEYLGWKELLPRIDAPGADAVSLEVNGATVQLTKEGDSWIIAPGKYLGGAIVVAHFGSDVLRRKFEFVEVPVSGNYKTPTDTGFCMVEVNRGADVLPRFVEQESADTCQRIENSVHRIYLGTVPGQFLNEAEKAAIQVSYFGEKAIPVVLDSQRLSESDTKVDSPHLVRKWRQVIAQVYKLTAHSNDHRQVLNKMKSKTIFAEKCQPIGGFSQPPTPYEDDDKLSLQRDALLAALAVRSLRRKGVPISQWNSMLVEHFNIDWKMARFIHRGWLEAGVIDEFSSTNSPGLNIFARYPKIYVFQSEDKFVGAINGLLMPSKLEAIKNLANASSVDTAVNFGPSPLIPPHLRLMADTEEAILKFAATAELDVLYLKETPFPSLQHRDKGLQPSVGYKLRSTHPTFTTPQGVVLRAFKSDRGPMFWSVESNGIHAWTYSSSQAEFLACHMVGAFNLKKVSSVDLSVESSFIPLTAARWIVTVGGVPAGPNSKSGLKYLYRLPSPEMSNRFINYYNQESENCLEEWSRQSSMRNPHA